MITEKHDYLKDAKQLVEGLSGVLGNVRLVQNTQKRVAQVVDYSVNQILNASPGNNTEEYADRIRKGIETIWWESLVEQSSPLQRIAERIPYGVLYLNSLGIRWRLLGGRRDYDYRVAAYLGTYFRSNENAATTETEYNKRIFSVHSRHMLYLACTAHEPLPVVLRMTCDAFTPKPRAGCAFRVITIPDWPSARESCLKALSEDKVSGLEGEELDALLADCLSWLEEKDIQDLASQFGRAGIHLMSDNKRADILRSVFNLYRGWHRVHQKTGFEGTTHYAYLPDPVLSGFAPAGFAGPICVEGFRANPMLYGRLLSVLQSMFARYFGHALQATESEVINVSIQEDLKGSDSWAGKYTSADQHVNTPLISNLRELTPTEPKTDFSERVMALSGVIGEQFGKRACPTSRMFADERDAALTEPPEGSLPEDVLGNPVFGYQALARLALETVEHTWRTIGVLQGPRDDPERKEKPEWQVYEMLADLLGFEPTLHYFPGYRDHFLHSFNSFLLGIWLLQRRNSAGKFILLPQVSDEAPKTADGSAEHAESPRNRLLRLWTVAAPIHDLAYPVQKLKDGIEDLFKRYTEHGCEEVTEFRLFTEWGTGLTKPHYYAFFHDSLRDMTASGTTLGHLAFRKSESAVADGWISDTQVSAELVKRLIVNGDHGVWAALFVRNRFFRYPPDHRHTGAPDFLNVAVLRPNDVEEICQALACHHIWEGSGESIEMDWELNAEHALVYLLILVDTLSQWGRTRELVNGSDGDVRDQVWREARLSRLGMSEDGNCICIEETYPLADPKHSVQRKDIESLIETYIEKPFTFLGPSSSSSGRNAIEITLFCGKEGNRSQIGQKTLHARTAPPVVRPRPHAV